MKTCPVCSARCFDDMEVCYGCMHRFDAECEGGEDFLGEGLDGEVAGPSPAVDDVFSGEPRAGKEARASMKDNSESPDFPGAASAPINQAEPSSADPGLNALGCEPMTFGQGQAPSGVELSATAPAPCSGAEIVSPAFSLGELADGVAYQIVISLRPCALPKSQ